MGWTDEAPTGRGSARDRWESLQALVVPGRGARRRPTRRRRSADFVAELDRRAAEQHAPVAEGVTLATLHAAKGLEWDVVFLRRHARGHDADHLRRRRPAAVEEERRLLYVGMTRARAAADGLLGAGPHPGRPRVAASRRGSSTGLRPRGASDERARARPVEPRAQGRRALPRVRASRWARPPSARSAAARTARRPTTRSCSSGCAPGGVERGRPGEGAGVRRVHRPDPAGDRRGQAGDAAGACCGSTASARPSSTKYGDDVLALVVARASCPRPLDRGPRDGPSTILREIPRKSIAAYRRDG